MSINSSFLIDFVELKVPHSSFLIAVLLHCFALPASAQLRKNAAYQAYIDKYKDLAVEQMRKYHIPASITLAQGLFESGAGQSQLAKNSNNHFGIKCHSDWKGKRIYRNDDNPNDCFRVYSSVRDSYEDHSRFLQAPRYSRLFKLNPKDYKGWAKGLKACGYATLSTYAQRLIDVIELYQLYQYDRGKQATYVVPADYHQMYLVNNLDCIIAQDGDTWESISAEMRQRGIRLSPRKLRKYNEAPSKDFFPAVGTHIFLQKKAKHADKNKYPRDYWHHVQAGESMYSVAQQYGIRLKNLYKLNFRTADYVPEQGDLLRVR